MKAVDLERVEEILHEALAHPPTDRAAFLDTSCKDDRRLRREVESLLACAGEAERLFGVLSPAVIAGIEPDAADPNLGTAVGGYRLVDRIGAGGMANVYRGDREDGEFDQTVAIKLIRRGLDTDEILDRFRRERQVLAGLAHPNIARLLTGGTTDDGRPYFAMEHVSGERIDDYCDARGLSIDERVELFRVVCDAVQFAHRALVVHRDLKPGNILVEDRDGTPIPKLLDFGIAKVLDDSGTDRTVSRTDAGRRRLTPAYASPEQVRGGPVTTAMDVYSLGVVLYLLLTGRSPYRTDPGSDDLEQAICNEPPVRPSAIADIPGDLERIVLKALHKDPTRRYATAEALSEDLGRYLRGWPIRARPDSAGYRLRMFVARHRAGLGVAAVIAVMLVAATVLSSVLYVQARAARALADNQTRTAMVINSYLTDLLTSVDPEVARGRDVTVLREALDRTSERIGDELENAPEVAAGLHRTIGETYFAIGEYEKAAAHLREAARLSEMPEVDPLERIEALLVLTRCLSEWNVYEEGRQAVTTALQVIDVHRPWDTALRGRALAHFGDLLVGHGQYEEAETRLRAAIGLLRQPGADPPDLAYALEKLGLMLVDKRRVDEARPLLGEAHDILKAAYGERHKRLATIETELGWCARRSGDVEAALGHYRRALAIRRELLDPGHISIANSVIGLTAVQEDLGHLEQAEQGYLEAIGIIEASVGFMHTETGTAYNNLGGLYNKMGRLEEAAEALEKATEIYAGVRGADDFWVSFPLMHRAVCLVRLEEPGPALDAVDEALRIRRLHIDEPHEEIQLLRTIRGSALAGLGRFTEAEKELLESRALMEATLAPDDLSLSRSARALIELYERWGRPEAVGPWRDKLAELEGGP
jgi:serine/threonine-protein kinase